MRYFYFFILISSSIFALGAQEKEFLKEASLHQGLVLTISDSEERDLYFSAVSQKEYRFQLEQQTALFLISVFNSEDEPVLKLTSTNDSRGPIIFTLKNIKETNTYRINVRAIESFAGQKKTSFKISLLENKTLNELSKAMGRSFQNHAKQVDLPNGDYDFEAIGKAIGDARVVFLGEATHKDAEMTTVKSKLIQWLHKHKGFNNVAFEACFYATDVLQQSLAAEVKDRTFWPRSLPPVWGLTQTFADFITYTEESQASEKPLKVYGIDTVRGVFTTMKRFSSDLKSYLDANSISISEAFITMTQTLVDSRKSIDFEEAAKITFFEELNSIRNQVAKLEKTEQNRFWNQCLTTFYDYTYNERAPLIDTPEEKYLRDQLMAENLQWLLQELPKDEKVIVWAASTHIARNLKNLTPLHPSENYKNSKRMGDFFRKDKQYYSIGLTAYQGVWGDFQMPKGDKPEALKHKIQVDQYDKLELEEYFFLMGYDVSFLDLASFANSNHWINKPMAGRVFGHAALIATWPEVFDGMIFIKNVSPTRIADWIMEMEKIRKKEQQEQKQREQKQQE